MSSTMKKPVSVALVAGIVGFALGLLWGWMIQPVEWVNADLTTLRPDLQEDYLRMAINIYSINGDKVQAKERWDELGSNAPQVLTRIAPDFQIDEIVRFVEAIEESGGVTAPTEAAIPPSGPSLVSYLVIGGSIVLFLIVASALFFFMRPRKRSGVATPAMQSQEFSRQTERTNFESLGYAAPITQAMTTYVLGDDLYDESFSIDSPAGEFLGEYGVGVSETIGVGDPKKVTALEVWLFDKNDIKTATKVLMSAHAFNDLATRQRLEAKGELVLIEPGQQVTLETATLQLLVTMVDGEYGEGPLPQNSYFERVTLELAIWPKE